MYHRRSRREVRYVSAFKRTRPREAVSVRRYAASTGSTVACGPTVQPSDRRTARLLSTLPWRSWRLGERTGCGCGRRPRCASCSCDSCDSWLEEQLSVPGRFRRLPLSALSLTVLHSFGCFGQRGVLSVSARTIGQRPARSDKRRTGTSAPCPFAFRLAFLASLRETILFCLPTVPRSDRPTGSFACRLAQGDVRLSPQRRWRYSCRATALLCCVSRAPKTRVTVFWAAFCLRDLICSAWAVSSRK